MSFIVTSIRDLEDREFARAACQSIYDGSLSRRKSGAIEPEYLYADGTLSPRGERYAAERLFCSWMVHFDFGKGVVHRIRIQLPDLE